MSSDLDTGSVDSVSEFERNLKKLLPDLHVKSNPSKSGQSAGTRKSERKKTPLQDSMKKLAT